MGFFLTIRQKTKIINTFANNMSTDIKSSKAKLFKIIQFGQFLGKTLGKMIGKLDKKSIIDLVSLIVLWLKVFYLN